MSELERIKTEEDRLLLIFKDLDENELQVARGLISQAAFMLITLEDLQEAISRNGSVGEYKNGKDQYGTKQSAELQAYNQTLRSYNSVIGRLLRIVPQHTVEEATHSQLWGRKVLSSTPEEMEQYRIEMIENINALNEQLGDRY